MVTYKCHKCNKIYKHKRTYKRHINRKTECAPNLPLSYKCFYCHRIYKRSYHLKRHMELSCKVRMDIQNGTVNENKKCNTIQNGHFAQIS